MSTRMGWIVGAVCLMIAGFAVLPAPAQDPKGVRPDAGQVRTDKAEGSKKKELDASFARLNAGQRSRLAVDFNEAKAASERATAILERILENPE